MRLYEVVYIFEASLDEAAIDKKLDRFHGVATDSGGEVVAVDHWGNRQLAYPVEGKGTGYYVVAHLETDPDALPEFERVLKLDDDLLRYLVVVNEGEPLTGESLMAPRPPSDDDDEEDEDDLDEDEDEEGPPQFSGGRGRRRRHEGPAVELLNYKDVSTLSKFVTEEGKILPRRTTKVSAPFQRQLSQAVKRARFLALVPYVREHEG